MSQGATKLATVVLFLSLCVAGAASAEEGSLLAALRETQAANAVYHNALYLYLRLAGMVWIAVEAVAAVVLWRAYRLLAQAATRQETR